MRWVVMLMLAGCYEHHLLTDASVGDDARVMDARVEPDAATRDALADVRIDAAPPCDREWFDEEVASGRTPVLYMHEGGDAEVLLKSGAGLSRSRRSDGSWSHEAMGITATVYAFDQDATAVFAAIEDESTTTLVRIDRDGSVELIGDPRFSGMDALWTSFTDGGTVLTWRQNIVQFAWCMDGPLGWACEEEAFGRPLEQGHAISDPVSRRVHVGRFRRMSDFEVRWGSTRWHLEVPNGDELDRTFSQVRAERDRIDAFVTTDLCNINHVVVVDGGEPTLRTIDVCARDGRFALARGSSLNLFTREDDSVWHLTFADGLWLRQRVPALVIAGPRGHLSGDAMLSSDGWLGLAYVVDERGRPSVRLLSSPPCD